MRFRIAGFVIAVTAAFVLSSTASGAQDLGAGSVSETPTITTTPAPPMLGSGSVPAPARGPQVVGRSSVHGVPIPGALRGLWWLVSLSVLVMPLGLIGVVLWLTDRASTPVPRRALAPRRIVGLVVCYVAVLVGAFLYLGSFHGYRRECVTEQVGIGRVETCSSAYPGVWLVPVAALVGLGGLGTGAVLAFRTPRTAAATGA